MRSFRIVNAALVLPDRLIPDGAIDVEDGRIRALGAPHELGAWSGPTVEGAGCCVAPGFVDLHVHGGDNADFMDGTSQAFETVVRAHTRHGTTTIVPTSTVARHEQTLALLRWLDWADAATHDWHGLTVDEGAELPPDAFGPRAP